MIYHSITCIASLILNVTAIYQLRASELTREITAIVSSAISKQKERSELAHQKEMVMFGVLRWDQTTRNHEHAELSSEKGSDARGYVLMACDRCRARKVCNYPIHWCSMGCSAVMVSV